MKLSQLNLLCALEQYHSFSQTASHLFLSQPALSTSIQALEKELNCTLLLRSNQGIQFTPAGKLALEKAHDILNEIVLIRSITAKTKHIPDHISIGGNTLACIELLLNIYFYTEKEYPQITVNFQEIDEYSLIHQLIYGTLDFAVLQINSMQPDKEQRKIEQKYNLQLLELLSEPMGIIVSANHPLNNRQHISISELFAYPFVTSHIETDRRLITALNGLGYQKEPLILQDVFCLNHLIKNTNHWALVPQREIERHKNNPQNSLSFLYPEDFPCYCSINWLHNNSKYPEEETMLLQTIKQILNNS